ncbi:unnamed protein product [Ilex paraguariensis]|uniref:Uncharacterized protein n=1 Tax=Ilex paraguariensis TaxID=185542 RepID=A0ABC8T6S0_9AQUA
MEEEEDNMIMWKPLSSSSPSKSDSMLSLTVGRVMTTLLSARPKKLQNAISRLDSAPKLAPIGVSLEQSLWFLHKYVRDAIEKEESLDQVFVPMIEHSLKCKESKHGNQGMILLNWLFQDQLLFKPLAINFAGIILRKEDRYIALGWCTLARGLIEYEITMNNLVVHAYWNLRIREKYNALLKILCSCITHLLSIVSSGSVSQGGFELPTRLSVAGADFILALTVALARKDPVSNVSDNKPKLSHSNAPNLPISFVPAVLSEKKVKSTSKSVEVSDNMEMKLLLWDHLEELGNLVQRLISWNRKSRSLHTKGLERVLKWLQGTKQHYGCFQKEAGPEMLKTGALLLSSCWKHYGMLMHLENYKFSQDYKVLLDDYLSGIQVKFTRYYFE